MGRDDYQRDDRSRGCEDYDYGEEWPEREEYWSDRRISGGARSDYGRYAYGGDSDDRGIESRPDPRGRGFLGGYYSGGSEFETRKPGGRRSTVYGRDYSDRDYDESYGERDVRAEGQVGRGPRGWRRPDERILEDVCDLMMQDPNLDASGIDVRVSDGEVILEGAVEGRWAKRLAEDIADSVPGVRDVHNRLRVNREVINQYPDAPYPM